MRRFYLAREENLQLTAKLTWTQYGERKGPGKKRGVSISLSLYEKCKQIDLTPEALQGISTSHSLVILSAQQGQ